ncbi:MAG TPA: hypothetical protein ACFYD2_02710, partial [Candidatus Avalokitesvara rifleensis]|uniref:hypothetical protein n=1 Tax=Candidatus Avalokitesvara rifleensis TaxID=3367620 RepID=UPI004024CAEE
LREVKVGKERKAGRPKKNLEAHPRTNATISCQRVIPQKKIRQNKKILKAEIPGQGLPPLWKGLKKS